MTRPNPNRGAGPQTKSYSDSIPITQRRCHSGRPGERLSKQLPNLYFRHTNRKLSRSRFSIAGKPAGQTSQVLEQTICIRAGRLRLPASRSSSERDCSLRGRLLLVGSTSLSSPIAPGNTLPAARYKPKPSLTASGRGLPCRQRHACKPRVTTSRNSRARRARTSIASGSVGPG